MGLFVPSPGGDFKTVLASHGTTRPAANFGVSFTPGNNTMGSWAQVMAGAAVTEDAYGILVNINSIAVSATAKDALVDIGVDPAGGTSYSVLLPYLLVSCAAPYNIGAGGVWYYFPVWIKAGSSIGVRGSVNNATVGTGRATCWLMCQPRRPESVKVGVGVEALGVTTASSRGTLVTLGTISRGSWTSLGATTNSCWFWQTGFGTNDTTMTAAVVALDIGADNTGSNILIGDNTFVITAAEQISNLPLTIGCAGRVAAGTTIYARGWSSNVADTQTSVAAYGVYG